MSGLMEIDNNIFLIPGENQGRFPFANSLLIQGDLKVLVDTGAGRSVLEALPPPSIDVVLNTHFHFDHIQANDMFPKAQIWIHQDDAPPLSDRQALIEFTGYDELPPEQANSLLNMVFRGYPVSRTFTEGWLDFGGTGIQVIELPGHSPGHCGFWFNDRRLLYATDFDLEANFPWYGARSSDLSKFRAAIKRAIDIQPDLLQTAHGPLYIMNIEERLWDFLEVIDKRGQNIVRFLSRQPATLDEITEQKFIFNRFLEPEFGYFFWEKISVRKHLDELLDQGIVTFDGSRYHAINY